VSGGVRDLADGPSQRPVEAGGSLSLELRARAGAAPTTPGRVSTVGSRGLGKQGGAVQRK
jgi:hypothetical protein